MVCGTCLWVPAPGNFPGWLLKWGRKNTWKLFTKGKKRAKKALNGNFPGRLRAVCVFKDATAWCVRELKCGEVSLPPVGKSLALNSDLSVSSVNGIKCTESLSLVLVLVLLVFSGVNHVQMEHEVQQMSHVGLKWSMLTRESLCWLRGRPSEKGGNCFCQDKEGWSGATTSFLFELHYFPFPGAVWLRKGLWEENNGIKHSPPQERWIGWNWCALWNLHVVPLPGVCHALSIMGDLSSPASNF